VPGQEVLDQRRLELLKSRVAFESTRRETFIQAGRVVSQIANATELNEPEVRDALPLQPGEP
jgi:hypothetical protein